MNYGHQILQTKLTHSKQRITHITRIIKGQLITPIFICTSKTA